MLIRLDHLQEAYKLYGIYHAIRVRLAEAEENHRATDIAKLTKMESTMCRTYTRFLRRIVWVGESYRTVNALQKGKCRPDFHRLRCELADGKYLYA